jgi:hypothetical protein
MRKCNRFPLMAFIILCIVVVIYMLTSSSLANPVTVGGQPMEQFRSNLLYQVHSDENGVASVRILHDVSSAPQGLVGAAFLTVDFMELWKARYWEQEILYNYTEDSVQILTNSLLDVTGSPIPGSKTVDGSKYSLYETSLHLKLSRMVHNR